MLKAAQPFRYWKCEDEKYVAPHGEGGRLLLPFH